VDLDVIVRQRQESVEVAAVEGVDRVSSQLCTVLLDNRASITWPVPANRGEPMIVTSRPSWQGTRARFAGSGADQRPTES